MPNTVLSVACKKNNSVERRKNNGPRTRKEVLLNLQKDISYGAGEF
jgi:hypothetical protein